METLADVDPETLLSGTGEWIDRELQSALAAYPLDCAETEYPHHVRAVESPEGPEPPSERHPVFYGCFDWHSAVHSHWCLVRLLRLFDDLPDADDAVASIDRRLTAERVAGEVAHFEENPTFEKPYGWGWFLRLAAELHLWDDDRAADWRETLRPLEARVVELVRTELLPQERPFRVGTHDNSAFALACVLDYARTIGDSDLEDGVSETARRFFGDDEDAPVAYEPLGWDFLSPSLAEADLMRRVLDPAEFESWLAAFLPDVTAPPHDAILDPVAVTDPEDGVELHLVGLNLSKAWCLAGVASELDDHPYAPALVESAERHAERGLARAFTDDYAGSHWLSSFVLYLLTRNDGGIAPDPLGV